MRNIQENGQNDSKDFATNYSYQEFGHDKIITKKLNLNKDSQNAISCKMDMVGNLNPFST